MRIGDAAAAAGLTPRALRYYEQRGLLTARRGPSGHREYGPDDVARLRTVRELLDAGLTIADVQAFTHVLDLKFPPAGPPREVDEPDSCPLAEITAQRLSDLDTRIARLTEARDRLADAYTNRFGELFRDQVA
ncbi:MerR family transcriptional regulator [Saccharopolyspora sp. NPDC050389]|uniref:MerR family transcriptional regulator n=1 Tax=Saccharopolyspora sp. NPDC050389 TaxID=3155516 RepID=UPI0033F95E02